jgi:hypothetical protein
MQLFSSSSVAYDHELACEPCPLTISCTMPRHALALHICYIGDAIWNFGYGLKMSCHIYSYLPYPEALYDPLGSVHSCNTLKPPENM